MAAQMKASELHRVIWNALLFVDKNSPTGPVVEFTLNGSELTLRSADAYSGLIERAYLTRRYMKKGEEPIIKWYMRKEDLQEAAKKLKIEPDATFDVMDLRETEVTCSDEQARGWKDFYYILQNLRIVETTGFTIGHVYLRLLYRLRPAGDCQMDFLMSEIQEHPADDPEPVVQFFLGPDIKGFVAPLDPVESNG